MRPERLRAGWSRDRIVEEIKAGQRSRDVGLEIKQPLGIDLPVQHGMARSPLFHELSENTGLIGILPLQRQLLKHAVAHRAAPPIGNDLLLIKPHRLLIHPVPRLGTRIEDSKVLYTMAGQFGKRRHGLRTRPTLTDNQFIRAEMEGLFPAEVIEGPGAHHGDRVAAIVGLIELRDQASALA